MTQRFGEVPEGWLEWPDEGRPDGVELAVTHGQAGLYVFVYADRSVAIFDSRGVGHLCGFGVHVPDSSIQAFLADLVATRT